MLELHVWGPVFGVPSIDAQCIAAITYLHNAAQDDVAFSIVPSNDASVSPSSMLHIRIRSHVPYLHIPSRHRPASPHLRAAVYVTFPHQKAFNPARTYETLKRLPADLVALPRSPRLTPGIEP